MKRMAIINKMSGRDSAGGFTLIEILVSMSILTVVMAAIFAFLWGASSYWRVGQNTADVTENARSGLNRMTRELKQSSNVLSASYNQVSFTVDFGTGAETVTYGFNPGSGSVGGTIWRSSSIDTESAVLVDNVDSVQYDYYGNDYRCDLSPADGLVSMTELQACSADPVAKIARVDITMTLSAGGGSQQTFVGQAWLRNRNVVLP